jgi:MFS transporter, MHS family, dicarboxylic acid transporter PcaT
MPAHLALERPPPQAGIDKATRIRSIIGACSGNLVEWYDFFAYAYTSIYFATSFFPSGDSTSQLLATAGIFAIGFVMRPLGGWLFGWMADTHGRKISMVVSVFMMCGGSLMIALLPTYAMVGVAAPALLLVARLIQGLSVGGEYGTGATYLSEISTKGNRGFYGSFQYFTIISGQLSALFVLLALQSIFSADELRAWAWRIPFFIGALAAVVVVYLRRTLKETASEEAMHHKEAGSLVALLHHKRALLLVFAFTMGGSLYFYTYSSYMQKFLVTTAKFTPSTASLVMMSALSIFMLVQPAFGALSDRIGIRNNMLLFTGIGTVATTPLLFALSAVTSPYAAFVLVLCALLTASFYTAVSGLVKADLFPAEVRALGVGLPYAVANAMFGGTAEYIALSLKSQGAEHFYFYYVTAVLSVSLAASLWMPDLRVKGYLDGTGEIER